MSRAITLPLSVWRQIDGDPRHWQIIALTGLFSMSWFTSDFGTGPVYLVAALSGAMLAQLSGTVWINYQKDRAALTAFQWKSAIITALGISILLRASDPWIWFAAGLIGIGLKFTVRINDKHVFNPACIGIVAMMFLVGKQAWVSPGQWGQAPLIAGYAMALAALVLSSAKRLDIAFGFIGTFAAILFARAVWLGDPIAIPLHQLSSGALLIFTFFMITDPRSTPDRRLGRLIFAASVACLTAWFIIGPNQRGAPLMALAALAFLTPLIDHFLPATRFQWTRPEKNKITMEKQTHDQNHSVRPGHRLRRRA